MSASAHHVPTSHPRLHTQILLCEPRVAREHSSCQWQQHPTLVDSPPLSVSLHVHCPPHMAKHGAVPNLLAPIQPVRTFVQCVYLVCRSSLSAPCPQLLPLPRCRATHAGAVPKETPLHSKGYWQSALRMRRCVCTLSNAVVVPSSRYWLCVVSGGSNGRQSD